MTAQMKNPGRKAGAAAINLAAGCFPPSEAERLSRASSFSDQRQVALALLNGDYRLSRKAGQFLGQLAVDSSPLSAAQAVWLSKLLERAGLPLLAAEART